MLSRLQPFVRQSSSFSECKCNDSAMQHSIVYTHHCGCRQMHSGPVNAHISKTISLSNKSKWTTQPLWPLWSSFPLLSQPRVLHRALPMFPILLVCQLAEMWRFCLWSESVFNPLTSLKAVGWSILIM